MHKRKELNNDILHDIGTYLDTHWKSHHAPCSSGAGGRPLGDKLFDALDQKLKAVLNEQTPSFSDALRQMLDEKGIKNSDVYKKAALSRQRFSKILSGHRPSKDTAIRLAFGLELNLEETIYLLNAAGYALSKFDKRDMIIQFCIENNCSTFDTDEFLDRYDMETLFSIL